MTYSKEITLRCDGEECNEWITYAVGAVTIAEKRATASGWSRPEWGEHYCPRCTHERDRQ